MTTCRQLITNALNEIKAYSAGETPTGDDIALGLARLQMISDTYITDSTTLSLDDDVPGPNEEAMLYELAFRLSAPFGYAFTAEQVANRRRAKSRLLADLDIPANADVEAALIHLSIDRFRGNSNFDTGEI